ncbi:MAG: ribosome assembly cofactor RimP [Prevotellaceae bacterium]|jgi:ribosome maturation factor RimP|nr:ribosome assembly cofactor RimP [Prevotellaceae bacterium]
MIDRTLVTELVEKNIAETDMFIVDVEVNSSNVISIILDSDTAVSIDNCADINKFVCNSLESLCEDVFELTVYSAGLSEPLKLKRQYIKHIGEEVEVLRKSGEKRKGILRHIDDRCIEIEYAVREKEAGAKRKKTVQLNEQIDLDSIKSTKLVIKI